MTQMLEIADNANAALILEMSEMKKQKNYKKEPEILDIKKFNI